MVVFRMPSRHTYGFAMGDDNRYDLPEIELRNLILYYASSDVDIDDVKFVPVDDEDDDATSTSRGSPRWIECAMAGDSTTSCDSACGDVISMAASRAVLTHATFSICECLVVTDESWRNSSSSLSSLDASGSEGHKYEYEDDDDDGDDDFDRSSIIDVLERMDVVDMSNPNMSRDSRTVLIHTIVRSISGRDNDVWLRLRDWILENAQYIRDATHERSPVLLHYASKLRIAMPREDDISGVRGQRNSLSYRHYIFLGRRTSIGPAGTRGAPSQTLRRTHRGLLKKFALRERRFDNTHASRVTSTAMEPEIGFLMSNVALSGVLGRHQRVERRTRVLDPCCGSGRLLLYAAALGATDLVGVDSDPNVWDAGEWDRQRGAAIGGGTLRDRAIPTFLVGDVRHPTSTTALCSPDSIDAIVCDPPYNIGAPILVDGRDMRPRSYHDRGDESRPNDCDDGPTMCSSHDVIPSILSIAANVLIRGGRIVFFLPVRGGDMRESLEELLSMRGFPQGTDGTEPCRLRLLKDSSRRQNFSPTFSRWRVCMEKI